MRMVVTEVGATLSRESEALLESVHRFAEDVLRPAGVALDRLADPADVIAPGSVLWDVFARYRELGIGYGEIEASDLDAPERAVLQAAINEELGWGDSGLAVSLGVSGFHRIFAQLSGRPELVERFCRPDSTEIGCWAVTEPDHGSDTLMFTEDAFRNPDLRANCIATLDKDHYVIRGQKSSWVSNGSIATVATLFCTIDGDEGFAGGGVCIVPLDLPGVSRGKPLDKLGQRGLNQGEIFFDEVRVPAEMMVVGKDAYGFAVESVLAMANAYMGTAFVGVARAAFEHALRYAKERVQGGVPIIRHQSVRGRIFKMFSQVEAARALSRKVALMGAAAPPPVQYSIASKTFCTTTAFEVASAAVQIYGGNGLSREYPVEKLFRDARASMIEDGCNEVLGLIGAARL
jgi:alkylation response protein AidB-like acyl-CoA dehydrogenase